MTIGPSGRGPSTSGSLLLTRGWGILRAARRPRFAGAATMPAPTRRRLLQAGTLAALGLTLPDLLRAAPRARRQASCIFIYQYGGLSQLDSWDPKPTAPADLRGPY